LLLGEQRHEKQKKKKKQETAIKRIGRCDAVAQQLGGLKCSRSKYGPTSVQL